MGNGVLIDDPGLLGEVAVVVLLLQQGDIALVEDDGAHLIIVKGVHQIGERAAGTGIQSAQRLVQMGDQLVGVADVQMIGIAVGVARRVADVPGRIVGCDDNGDHVRLHKVAGDAGQGTLGGAHAGHDPQHAQGRQRGGDAADQLAGLVPAQGGLDDDADRVQDQ